MRLLETGKCICMIEVLLEKNFVLFYQTLIIALWFSLFAALSFLKKLFRELIRES